MNDADIAVGLMNRLEQSGNGQPTSVLELLHEGGLHFRQTKTMVQKGQSDVYDRWEIECLTFDDGSTALRFLRSRPTRDTTPWAAVAPHRKLLEQTDELDS